MRGLADETSGDETSGDLDNWVIEAIGFVRFALTKGMSRIATPQSGQTISLPKVWLGTIHRRHLLGKDKT